MSEEEVLEQLNNLLRRCGFGFDKNDVEAITFLIQENQQLKSQLEDKKHELNGFVNTIAKYLEIEDEESATYDEIIEKLVNLKGAKQQLKQANDVLDEIKDVINQMITTGYTDKDRFTSYFAVGEQGEFGCRAKVILAILNKRGGTGE